MMSSEITHNKPDFYFIGITLIGVILPLCLLLSIAPGLIAGESFVISDDIQSICSSRFVCINHATKAELTVLNGIGETKANAIIEYREKNGYFTTKEDIMLVDGIGEKILEDIYDDIAI